ncbi:hypothetical protein PCE1_000700 [Barthelona sp. PCE]
MRKLTEDETRLVFEKLAKFIGGNLRHLVERPDEKYCFRMHKTRLFYMSENQLRRVTPLPRKQLVASGVCFGKFTKSGKFQLQITALPYLAQFALNKVVVNSQGEMTFTYGQSLSKGHVEHMTEGAPVNAGVVVFNEHEDALGFGVLVKGSMEFRHADNEDLIVIWQSDIGEYLRTFEDQEL